MRTLDEVIKALENVALADTDGESEGYYLAVDSLHYLRELRDMTDIPMEYFESGGTSQKLRNTSQITCPKCHSEFVILPEANNPLTWDELKQMEGKPVWVELLYHHPEQKYKYWDVIKRFDAVEGYDLINLVQTGYLHKSLLNREWQAYRKERS